MIGDIKKETNVSAYQPSKEIADFTGKVKKDYSTGWDILNRSYVELNNYSPLERANKDQRSFNSFVDESVDDPNESWKWRGTRSLARNKAMALHAHLTSGFIIPTVVAQNEAQKEDRDTSEVMKDILEWMTVNSNYRTSFLLATQGMLVNPVTYLEGDFFDVSQKILEKIENGYAEKEVLDETLSGFQANVLSLDQVLITNVYEQNIQKQRVITKRRFIEYSEAEAKYKDHENLPYVQPGLKCIFNDDDGMFYDTMDDTHPNLIEEVTWFNRRQDAEVCFLNGIYFGNSNLSWNPIRHRDNRNTPKYNIVPFGYERVNEHFYFFKSLINRIGWDDKLIDAMYEVQMNREFLDLETPLAISGVDSIDSNIVFPGATIALQDKDSKVSPLIPPSSGNGYRAMREIEDSMSQSSISETEMGQLPDKEQKAFSVSQASQNAKILLSGVKKTLGESVRQFGDIMIDIALQHLTTAQVDEITGNTSYRSFFLQDQTVGGKKVSKWIRFDDSLLGTDMSEEQKTKYNMKLLEEIGYPDNKEHLYMVNPHLFSKLKYYSRIEAEAMDVKSREFKQAVIERLFQLLRNDPLIEPEALVRELVYAYKGSGGEDLINKNAQQVQQIMGAKTPTLPAQSNQVLQRS